MSNIVTAKFTGLLRGLLRRFERNGSGEVVHYLPLPAAAALSPTPPPHPASAPAHAATPPPARSENPNELELPLQTVLASLPMELRAKIMQTPPPGSMIIVPVEKVLGQLALGSVKISFGELRLAAPDLFVNSGGEFDARPVTLPLNEILARLNPALLSRRAAQKQMQVADDITGPFEANGRGVTFTNQPLKPATATPPMSRLNQPVAAAPEHPPVAPPPPAFVPRSITPASAPVANDLIPLNGKNNENGSTNGQGHNNGLVHNNGNGNGNGNGHAAPLPPVFSDRTAPVSVPSLNAAPQIPLGPAEKPVLVPLSAVTESWPDGLKLEIAQASNASTQIALPANLVEPALKRGRVTFSWKFLRALLRPTPMPASVHDSVEVELPLKVVAPLFFARPKPVTRLQQKVSAAQEIPDLFFGFPQPQPAPVPSPALPVPPVTPMAKPVDQKIADTNFYVWGENSEVPKIDETEYRRAPAPATDFTSRYATPKDIVERTAALPGVAGAVVALPDGLRVASQVPADLNADTLAAFLPQIFDRLGQSTRELRMGTLNNVSFTVGNVPWKIFRVNSVYFAAFGRAGESHARLTTGPAGHPARPQKTTIKIYGHHQSSYRRNCRSRSSITARQWAARRPTSCRSTTTSRPQPATRASSFRSPRVPTARCSSTFCRSRR